MGKERIEYLVFGYIREVDDILYEIPNGVSKICLNFYGSLIRIQADERQYDIDEEMFIITKKRVIGDTWDNKVLIGDWMSMNAFDRVICKIKINHLPTPAHCMLGIVGNDDSKIDEDRLTKNLYDLNNKMGYTMDASERCWIHGHRRDDAISNGTFKGMYPKNNVYDDYECDLVLDMKLSKLHYSVNHILKNGQSKNIGSVSLDIKTSDDIQYIFAVSLCTVNNSITIRSIHFS